MDKQYFQMGCVLVECTDKETTSCEIHGDIQYIAPNAFRGCNKLSKIVIHENIKKIGAAAFMGCSSLNSVIIESEFIDRIEDSTFMGCKCLRHVVLPPFVSIIGNMAFEGCCILTKVLLPDTVKEIGHFAFAGCTKLESLNISPKIEHIGQYALADTKIPSLDISESQMTFIEEGMCAYCRELKECILPATVTEIGDSAFERNYRLTHINLPENLESIGKRAFFECRELKKVIFPYQLNIIDDFSFHYCDNIQRIDIPLSVKSIGDGAFSLCKALEDINFDYLYWKKDDDDCYRYRMYNIGNFSFFGCDSLKKIKLPASVVYFGEGVFACCWGLTDVTMPTEIEYFFDNYSDAVIHYCFRKETNVYRKKLDKHWPVFLNCISLKNVNMPESYSSLSDKKYLFDGCPLMGYYISDDYYYEKTKETTSNKQISSDNDSNTSVFTEVVIDMPVGESVLSNNIVELYTSSYSQTDKLKVIIPEGVTEIAEDAFSALKNKKNIRQIQLPGTLQRIGEYAFYGVPLEELSIPNSVVEIGNNAFENCNIKKLHLPNNETIINEGAFIGIDIDQIVISRKTKAIHRWAFSGTIGNIKILTPNCVIDETAFYCPNSTEVHVKSDNPDDNLFLYYWYDCFDDIDGYGEHKAIKCKLFVPKGTRYKYLAKTFHYEGFHNYDARTCDFFEDVIEE